MLIIVQYIFSVSKIYSIDTKDLTCSKGVFLHKVSFVFFIEAALNRCLSTSNLADRKYKEKFNFQFFVSDFHSAKRGLI